jgi:hypothetical protein
MAAFLFFFRGSASRPCGPPALWSGAPLQAAAGQATAVKLQINGRANVKMMIDQVANFASISPSFVILSGFETAPF